MWFKRASSSAGGLGRERFATLIGEATSIKGDLVLSESIRIDGRLDGDATRGADAQVTVVVGPGGRVVGNITATRVVIAGSVQGTVFADESVELQATAELDGDVHCQSLRVEHGARLSCRLAAGVQPAAPSRPVLVSDQGEPAKAALKSV